MGLKSRHVRNVTVYKVEMLGNIPPAPKRKGKARFPLNGPTAAAL